MRETKKGVVRDVTRWLMPALTMVVAAALMLACGGGGDKPLEVRLAMDSLKPEWVSGDDALVRVSAEMSEKRSVRMRVNGNEVAATFGVDPSNPTTRVGLITGLVDGQNTMTAEVMETGQAIHWVRKPAGQEFPRTGPMFSGAHEMPFICQTQSFGVFPGGPLLGAALDTNCSIATRVHYVYRNAADAFVALPGAPAVPADVQTTTTTDGRTVPYIVRIETGTANRAIYQTSMLHNPAAEPVPSPVVKPQGWNGAVVYTFGGGCAGGWYRQGSNTGGVLDHNILKHGFALASSSLNVYGNNCNDVLAAESVAMVRERFREAYGRPRHVIGWGCSGGSYQQLQTVDNYPELLDGIIPSCSFP